MLELRQNCTNYYYYYYYYYYYHYHCILTEICINQILICELRSKLKTPFRNFKFLSDHTRADVTVLNSTIVYHRFINTNFRTFERPWANPNCSTTFLRFFPPLRKRKTVESNVFGKTRSPWNFLRFERIAFSAKLTPSLHRIYPLPTELRVSEGSKKWW